ncbi:YqgE/AlgH family protein [Verrucomicrobiota bacterium sgz303538]
MREPGSPLTLSGSLLIAHPGLLDPNFHKTVLFLSTHDAEEGSFALILNRPAERTVADLLPDRDMGPLGSVPVFLGGPVSNDQLIFAFFRWNPASEKMECHHHIGVEEAQQVLKDDNATVRAFVGYAGWTKGQLEGELAQRAWMVKAPDQDVLDLDRIPELWRDLTASFGPLFRIVAEAPEDPSRN